MAKSHPYQTKINAMSSMDTSTTRTATALPWGVFGLGRMSTLKWVCSRTAMVEPSMIIQMKKKRAASSVQM